METRQEGCQTPRYAIVPHSTFTDGQICGELAADYGLKPDPWQQTVLDGWLACYKDGTYVAGTCGLTVPRQNGKNAILEMVELFKSAVQGRKILHTAHEVKCLDLNTPILTVAGWKTMGELTNDDMVYGDDGVPVSLIAHPIQYGNPCYKITFDDGQTIVADDGHLWGIDYKPQWGSPYYRELTTQQMVDEGVVFTRKMGKRIRHEYKFRTYLPKPLKLPYTDLPFDPWVIGYWLGDGTSKRGEISCGEEDIAYLLGQLTSKNIGYSIRQDKRTGVYSVTPKGLKKALSVLNMLDNKHIPESYLLSSIEQRRSLLAGLMDSDGTSANNQCQIGMMNERLIDSIMILVRSLGYKATKNIVLAKCGGVPSGRCYRVQFRAYRGESPFFMPRKTNALQERRLRSTTRSCYNAIVSIEKIASRPTRCITVYNASKLYCVGKGFIVTHNTCRKAFLRLKGFFENEKEYPELVSLVQIIRQTNGQEAITLKNGGSIEFIARSKSSGLGFTVDDVICDEAQLLDQEQVATLRPTMSAAPSGNPQMIMTGTPPRPNTPGDVFEMTRKKAITGDDKRTCWFEWSVEEVGDVRDLERVAAVNPALGRRLQMSVIEDELATMDADGFARERLGWWATTGYKRIIDQKAWENCAISAEETPQNGKMGVGVKFSQDGTKYALSIALKSKDKPLYVEFYDYGNMADGIRPLADWILNRKKEIAVVAIDGKSGSDALVQMLHDGKFPRKGIMLPGTKGVVAASSQFLNDINEGNVTHLIGQEELDESALKSEKRLIGREGGWGFGGESSLAIESAAIGLWGVKETRRSPGRGSRIL